MNQQGGTWQTFQVAKPSNSGTDQLQTIGLAVLAAKTVGSRMYVFIRDADSHYRIELAQPLTRSHLASSKRIIPFESLRIPDNAVKLQGMQSFDYMSERDVAAAYRERRKRLEPALRGPTASLANAQELYDLIGSPPDPLLPIYSSIRGYKVVDSVNKLARFWHDLPDTASAQVLAAIFSAFSQLPNDIEGLTRAWHAIAKEHNLTHESEVTQLQITNSTAGKGTNQPKAKGVTPGNLKGLWLLELLKIIGYFHIAIPLVVQGEAKDRKTYILRPREAELNTINTIVTDFRKIFWGGSAVKLDIIASLRFVDLFYRWHETRIQITQDALEDPSLKPRRATAFVHGFDVISSKNMGNAFATMNLATINLPDWLPEVSQGAQDEGLKTIRRARRLLQEHLKIVQLIGNRGPGRLADEGSEELELLKHYRDFLSARKDLAPFFQFTDAYGPYIMAQRSRKRMVKQLTTEHLEVLMTHATDEGYLRITRNEGFRRIASCIRAATVSPQIRANTKEGTLYDTRYGLGPDLVRAAKDKEEFIAALGEFLASYRAENARILERLLRMHKGKIPDSEARKLRASPTTNDIDQVMELTQCFGPKAVCSLLLAYGFARDPRDPTTNDDKDSDADAIAADEDDATDA